MTVRVRNLTSGPRQAVMRPRRVEVRRDCAPEPWGVDEQGAGGEEVGCGRHKS